MSILQNLVAASQLDESVLRQQARSRQATVAVLAFADQ